MSKLKPIILIFVLLVTTFVIIFKYFDTETQCKDISQEQAIDAIRTDFSSHSMRRWDLKSSPDAIGAIKFETDNIQISEGVISLPIKFNLQGVRVNYFAMYICKSGKIEYGRSE